jgi:hypothetical protein
MAKVTWLDDVLEALRQLGGKAHLHDIYNTVRTIRRNSYRTLPKTLENQVRKTLEDHCSEAYFRARRNIFFMPEGKGVGVWAILPDSVVDIDDLS